MRRRKKSRTKRSRGGMTRVGGGSGDGAYLGHKDGISSGPPVAVQERHEPASSIRLPSLVSTGHDLTGDGIVLRVLFVDDNAAHYRPWPICDIDIDAVKASKAISGNTVHGYCHVFDNDYVTMRLDDIENGVINFADAGRQMRYAWSELAPTKQYVKGESAYQIAVRLGFSGTEQEWLNSLGAIL